MRAPIRNIAVESMTAIVFAATTQPRACRRIVPRRMRWTSATGIRTMTSSGRSRTTKSSGIALRHDHEHHRGTFRMAAVGIICTMSAVPRRDSHPTIIGARNRARGH
jgi:hypothetical protein